MTRPTSTWLATPDGPLAAWHYQPDGPTRDLKVLIAPSFGYEDEEADTGMVALARKLAVAGFETLTYDHAGTDQSPGGLDDADVVSRWIRDIATARAFLGHSEIAVIATRAAALFALAALDGSPVDTLVLLSPSLSGKRVVRELQIMQSTAHAEASTADGLVVGGFEFPTALLNGVKALNINRLASAPARSVIAVDSPARPLADGTVETLTAVGAAVEHWQAPDLDQWLDIASTFSLPPNETLDRLVAHLVHQSPSLVISEDARGSDGGTIEFTHRGGTIVEQRSLIGDVGLHSSFTRPLDTHDQRTAVLFLSTVGPGDCFSRAARDFAADGIASLRLDFAGFKESGVWPDQKPGPSYYEPFGQRDIRVGVEHLLQLGYDSVVVVGICSAAWAMLMVGPINGVSTMVLVNPAMFVTRKGVIPEFVSSHPTGRRDQLVRTVHWAFTIGSAQVAHYAHRQLKRFAEADIAVNIVFADSDTGYRFWRLALARRDRNTSVHVFDNLGHNLDNPAVRREVIEHIRNMLRDMPHLVATAPGVQTRFAQTIVQTATGG